MVEGDPHIDVAPFLEDLGPGKKYWVAVKELNLNYIINMDT